MPWVAYFYFSNTVPQVLVTQVSIRFSLFIYIDNTSTEGALQKSNLNSDIHTFQVILFIEQYIKFSSLLKIF